jgi:hypothetical protein
MIETSFPRVLLHGINNTFTTHIKSLPMCKALLTTAICWVQMTFLLQTVLYEHPYWVLHRKFFEAKAKETPLYFPCCPTGHCTHAEYDKKDDGRKLW